MYIYATAESVDIYKDVYTKEMMNLKGKLLTRCEVATGYQEKRIA
jgi:hypothetical protein